MRTRTRPGPEFAQSVQRLRDRILSRVETKGANDCWPWKGRIDANGYGYIDIDGRPITAHRAVFFALNPETDTGLEICHTCDNPPCCNPAHLFAGTHAENVADMRIKGRGKNPPVRRGTACNKAKLTAAVAREIVSSNLPNRTLAEKYGVTPSAIYNIRHGKAWSHVTGIRL